MAQYRGTVQGSRGEVSRLGSKTSGMDVTCAGWESGVRVVARFSKSENIDVFDIYATTGTNGNTDKLVGRVIKGEFYPITNN